MVERFGADAFRLYEMFIGPFENTVPWKTDGLVGTYRFIEKVYKQSQKVKESSSTTSKHIETTLHKVIKKVSEDIENFKFNTAVSSMMIVANELKEDSSISLADFKKFIQILAPFAPHVADELWHELGETESIHLSPWPTYDASKILEDEMTIVIQVAGKVRGELVVSPETSEEEIKSLAQAHESAKKWTEGKTIVRVIYVKGKLVNIVLA
jgi:leucyl-tRNA synthetase